VLETALGRRAEAHLASLAERTGALLTEHRASVLAVGHALEMHKTISGQDVTAIINGEEGPVVDGRPYLAPDFLAELEAYHLRAVSAHGGDRGLPMPVPVPHGQLELTTLPATTLPATSLPATTEHGAEPADWTRPSRTDHADAAE
jgi:hypothetical protein